MSDKPIQAAYTVAIKADGSIFTEVLEPNEGIQRRATTFDIYQTSKELVSDIDSQLLSDRVVRAVVSALQPKDESEEIRARVLDALNDRGIEKPSV
jgi:hypothetical protein